MTVRRDELDAIVLEQDLEQRAHAAALTFARVALRAELALQGARRRWRRERVGAPRGRAARRRDRGRDAHFAA